MTEPADGGNHDAVADDVDARLERAVDGLRHAAPEESAFVPFTRPQRIVGVLIVAVVIAGFVVSAITTMRVVAIVLTLLYVAMVSMRLYLMWAAHEHAGARTIDEDVARAVPDAALPVYTVMVPAYGDASVMPQLVDALSRLEYPVDKLEILLVLESDDRATIVAAREAIAAHPAMRVVEVPPSQPRTKPKALNYAMAEARGDLITIYDAEDIPEPLQLRRAALALTQGSSTLACVQGQLTYFNPEQNLLTRWFAIEYAAWFRQFLPGLVGTGAPIPLGGTSNHFKREVLEEVGGWDPYNVTEDADLGVRLHRRGYHVGVIESATYEEANSDFVNWVKQRSRWYKGYLQTWLVNLRHPVQRVRDLGLWRFVIFNLFVGGTPMLALMNPIFWGMTTVWFIAQPEFIRQIYVAPLFYVSFICWIVGNFLLLYGFVITAVEIDRPKIVRAALAYPLYWAMMSLAAYKALLQLVFQPSYWEKTTHGLARPAVTAGPAT